MDTLRLRVEHGQEWGTYSVLLEAWTGQSLLATRSLSKTPISAVELAASLFRQEAAALLADVAKNTFGGRFLIEIVPDELTLQPWEKLVEGMPIGVITGLWPVRRIPSAKRQALVVVDLPVDALFVAMSDASLQQRDLRSMPDALLRYFAATISNRTTPQDLRDHLRRKTFDIVHLQGEGFYDPRGQSRIGRAMAAQGVAAPDLLTLLLKAGAKLVILEGTGGAPLVDFAHRLHRGGIPAVLVIADSDPQTAAALLADVYMGIVHDQSLDRTVWGASPRPPIPTLSLFLSPGAEDALRVSDRIPVMQAQNAALLTAAQRATAVLDLYAVRLPLDARAEPSFSLHRSRISEFIPQLTRLSTLDLSFLHETEGLVPLGDACATLRESAQALGEVGPYVDRVVNAWVSKEGSDVDPHETLGVDQSYELHVGIGSRDRRSLVRDAMGLPEWEFEKLYSEGGLDLRVCVFGNDFQIEDAERELRLPQPPEETEVLLFRIRPRRRAKAARLRICVYYRHNLLQSILVRVAVTEKPKYVESGAIRAEIEFALTRGFDDVQDFPARALNILANEGPNGTHAFAILGDGVKRQLDFTEGQMRTRVTLARRELQAICSTFDKKGNPKDYRFDDDNRGKPEDFVASLISLAKIGYELYAGILTGGNATFRASMDKALAAPGRIIQIARTKSAQYVFPWSVVYDAPLHPAKSNVVCPRFLDDLKAGKPGRSLESQWCLTGKCPHFGDLNVVCPSGFWGFRHIVEQPLSLSDDANSDPLAPTTIFREIEHDGAMQILMGVSEKLNELANHRQEMGAIPGWPPDVRNSWDSIGRSLQSPTLHAVYFYCHGGRDKSTPFLGVGKEEQLYPTDFVAWRVAWPVVHPLVFINGCETIGLTPDDLLAFNTTLTDCKASAVIGVEITIPEPLARAFGREFFAAFLAGDQMGEIVRRVRLRLLERYNPLGLAYTAYGVAELHLKQATAPPAAMNPQPPQTGGPQ